MVAITSLAADEHSARIVLAATLEPDDPMTGRLIAAVEAVDTVRLGSGTGAMPEWVDPVDGELWRKKAAVRLDANVVARALAETDRLGLGVLVSGDRDWPTGLNDLGDRAPTAVWIRGAASLLTGPLRDRVTITGARAVTGYGEHVASELASDLASAERIIVAGGAYGIDAAAHRAALSAGGQTVAVLAGGLDRLYPTGNQELLERTGDLGLLLSELAPGSAPTRTRFLARNRVLAALSGATVIVEAGFRSGALDVATRAAHLGRPVGAVPGPVTSAASSGTHQLLRTRTAALITGVEDINALLETSTMANVRAFGREDRISRSARQPRPGRAL
ncbi:DNA-processing protein DprA [Propionibacterium freudenreichii]|uniref:DNA-processing protein DprA n=1 Tax=Propionibacterium freudenreichii TaxID=1744 RepID=UPI0005A5CE77|nr:DNA-processing protein DprA [Propionibacterium freudenreichii]CEI48379.1 DNA processing factor [Propionibacterium freudenreichii]